MKLGLACQSIIRIGQTLHQKGWLASADGNISYRIDQKQILITPSGAHKGFLRAHDLCLINHHGETVSGGKPSSESLMHLTIYQNVPQAKAVVHAHPPLAIAWSIAFPEAQKLPVGAMSELILAAGDIPIAPYARPGTQAMGEVLKPLLPQHRIIILSRHGALAWGEDLEEAYRGIERLEHAVSILWSAHSLGRISSLSEEETLALRELREKIGPRIL